MAISIKISFGRGIGGGGFIYVLINVPVSKSLNNWEQREMTGRELID